MCYIYEYFVNSAAFKGNVQRLMSYATAGADPTTAKDMYGRTPLHAVSKLTMRHYNICIDNLCNYLTN